MGGRFYSGGTYGRKCGFDKDKFGYVDVVGEVVDLGNEKWNCIAYNVPKTIDFIDLKDDEDVTQMLHNLSKKCRCFSIYVDGGLRKGIDNGWKG